MPQNAIPVRQSGSEPLLQLVPATGDPNSYHLRSGDIDVGVVQFEQGAAGEQPAWFYSIHAIHLVVPDLVPTGKADNLGDALHRAERCWAEIISGLGLKPA